MPWYVIPRVLKLANIKMYVWNGYNEDSETVNVLARHTALNREAPVIGIGGLVPWYWPIVVYTIAKYKFSFLLPIK